MRPAFHIRPAQAADIENVVALDRATESLPHWPAAEHIAALQAHRCLFVAETLASPQVVGFAVGQVAVIETEGVTEVLADLESVAVTTSFRRAGIGRALCHAIIDWSIGRGATAIDLEVRGRSEGAITLYRQIGFAAVGRRPNYYRDPPDDAILMRLEPGTDQCRKQPCNP